MSGRPRDVQYVNGIAQLPNGDMWTGHVKGKVAESNVPQIVLPTSVEDAVAQLIASQAGKPKFECVWCAMEFERKDLSGLRDHIEAQHKSVMDDSEGEKAALEAALMQATAVKK